MTFLGLLALLTLVAADEKTALPAKMKAGVLIKKPLDTKVHLEDLTEVEVDVPTVKMGQVLVKVEGASLNPVDWKLIEMQDQLHLNWSYPHILGRDFAGKVAAVGEGVTQFKVGDSVWGDNANYEGSFAEYVAVDQSIVGIAPTHVPLAEAAVLPLVALTGLEAYHFAAAPWTTGPTVVVLGGSGGAGHTGIQLAKALGAGKVISTCGTSNVEFCKSMGADHVIDYHKEDWTKVVPEKSVDVVYDTVAIKGTGDLAYSTLKDNGYFVTLLPDAVASSSTATKRPSIKQENFMLSQIQTKYLDILKGFADAGKLRPHVDETFSIAEIRTAVNASMAGRTVGKISVVPKTSSLMIV